MKIDTDCDTPMTTENENTPYLCPISMEIMIDPVVTPNGDSYERQSIVRWIETKGTCPSTRNHIRVIDLISNKSLQNTIKSKYPELFVVNEIVKIKPPPNHNQINNTNWSPRNWIQTRPVIRSNFVNTSEITIMGSQRQNNIAMVVNELASAIINRNRIAVTNPISDMPVLPQTYDFNIINEEHTRRMLKQAYDTITRINMWNYLHNYAVDETLGFQWSQDTYLKYITDEIENVSRCHSGASMSYTMRNMHCIAMHGIAYYEQCRS